MTAWKATNDPFNPFFGKSYEEVEDIIRGNGKEIRHVKLQSQTLPLCLTAILNDPRALMFCGRQTPEICLEAIKQDPMTLEFVQYNNLTSEVIKTALEKKPEALEFVPDELQTPEMVRDAVERVPSTIRWVSVTLFHHFEIRIKE